MRKELRPTHDAVSCAVCGRTILKGERTEAYLAPGGQRKLVCELCTARADHEGWIRESAHGDMPATRPREQRRPLLGRLRRDRREEAPAPQVQHEPSNGLNGDPAHEPTTEEHELAEQQPAPAPPRSRRPNRRKDPRHVRAVPTNAPAKSGR